MTFRKGFSLLEMIIVIAIIAIIGGILAFKVPAMLHSVKVKAWNSDMATLKQALMVYATDETHGGSYPDAPSSVTDLSSWLTTNKLNAYLDKSIVDPFHKDVVVEIGPESSVVDIDGDVSGTSAQFLGYDVQDGTDVEGNPVKNGHFTLYWKVSGQEYEISDQSGVTKVSSSSSSGSGS